jgi:serine/threonine-protein kinase RsbW
MTWARLDLTSELTSLDHARQWAGDHAAASACDKQTVFAIQLALTETLSNVVRHAYGGHPGHPIRVEMEVEDTRVRLRVTDWGEPFDVASFEPLSLDVPREGGYGVHLIRTLMDEVSYDTTNAGVTVVDLVRLRPQPDDLHIDSPNGSTPAPPASDM